MSEKTYTAAEVAILIAEAKAKASTKGVKFSANSGTFTTKKGETKPFANIRVEGNFYPATVSYSVAEAILAHLDEFKAIVNAKPKVEAPVAPLSNGSLAPRLGAKS